MTINKENSVKVCQLFGFAKFGMSSKVHYTAYVGSSSGVYGWDWNWNPITTGYMYYYIYVIAKITRVGWLDSK